MVNRSKFLVILASLLLTTLACSLPGGDNESSGGSELPSDILFMDDFSYTSSGWDRVNTDVWSNPGLNFTDSVIEVDTSKVGGPDDNDFGIICRYQNLSNFYFFIVSSDGFYGIAKVTDGEQELIGLENMEYSDAINQGNSSNKLRADCNGQNLALYINGQKLMEITDSEYSSGDVGLIAGTFDVAGTELQFDNFVVRKP